MLRNQSAARKWQGSLDNLRSACLEIRTERLCHQIILRKFPDVGLKGGRSKNREVKIVQMRHADIFQIVSYFKDSIKISIHNGEDAGKSIILQISSAPRTFFLPNPISISHAFLSIKRSNMRASVGPSKSRIVPLRTCRTKRAWAAI